MPRLLARLISRLSPVDLSRSLSPSLHNCCSPAFPVFFRSLSETRIRCPPGAYSGMGLTCPSAEFATA
eukprot:364212-Chlamydomonas_euryale.AAC.8